MRPTPRAIGVAAAAVAAVALAYTSGTRALNAVAAPALVVLVAGALQVALADAPTVEQSDLAPGFPGETRTVDLTVEGTGLARVVAMLPEGVAGAAHELRLSLPGTASYEVELAERGVWRLGPTEVVVTDVLGLFTRTTTVEGGAAVTVYPLVYDLTEAEALSALLGSTPADQRAAFDDIREYVPGDPLRDVHWKSSAKRPSGDLVVAEFADERAAAEVHVVASAAPGYADEMAAAAASVARFVLATDRPVALTCPAGSVPADYGDDHRQRLLALLAETGGGEPGETARERADALVHADADGVTVTVDGRETAIAVPAERTGHGSREVFG